MRIFWAVAFGFLSAASCGAKELVWKVDEGFWDGLIALPTCDIEKDEYYHDYVPYLYKSPFGVNIYFTYFEGVRMTIGFSENDQSWGGGADTMHPGAFDVGGVETGGVFTPMYVIKRFYASDPETELAKKNLSYLVIFRLRGDGTACVSRYGENGVVLTQNGVARKMAERDADHPPCADH